MFTSKDLFEFAKIYNEHHCHRDDGLTCRGCTEEEAVDGFIEEFIEWFAKKTKGSGS